jgi:hypothetical protein
MPHRIAIVNVSVLQSAWKVAPGEKPAYNLWSLLRAATIGAKLACERATKALASEERVGRIGAEGVIRRPSRNVIAALKGNDNGKSFKV